MFSIKNISPRQLSFFTSLGLAIPVSLLVLLIEKDWIPFILSFFIILFGGYLLISFVLERFIYRKIKLIYKFIYQTKATRKEETYYKYVLPQKSIDEVREDVEKWAEQRQGEIELLKANEAYRKEFLQNLAHELKTPIFAIQGYIDTLLDGASSSPELLTRFLQKTSRNAERLVNLIQDLDEISKLESGRQPLYKENFVIHDLIKEVFESLSLKAQNRRIKCTIKKGTEQPVVVFADKEKIRQVLINMIDNAIKYGEEGGNVVASVYNTDGKMVFVEISDNGIGISEEHLSRVFERFYRTDLARSRNIGGSGLGLDVALAIARASGGALTLENRKAGGGCVVVELPAEA